MDRNVDRPGGAIDDGAHDGHGESAALDAENAEPKAPAGSRTPGPRSEGKGIVRNRLYQNGRLARENFPPEQISDHLHDDADCVVWLDLCQPDSEQLAIIGTEFGLHKLAIEDALDETQRTKIDRYSTHLFLSAHSARLDPGSAS